MTKISTCLVQLEPRDDASAEELSDVAISLRRDLQDLDVHDVVLARDREAPRGTKGLDAATLGHVLVAGIPSGSLLGVAIAIVRSKLLNSPVKSATLEIDGAKLQITGLETEEQQALISTWIAAVEKSANEQ